MRLSLGRLDGSRSLCDELHCSAHALAVRELKPEKPDVFRLHVDGVSPRVQVIRAGRRDTTVTVRLRLVDVESRNLDLAIGEVHIRNERADRLLVRNEIGALRVQPCRRPSQRAANSAGRRKRAGEWQVFPLDRFQERRHFELVGREGQLEPPIASQPDAAVQMRARLCPHQVGASNGER